MFIKAKFLRFGGKKRVKKQIVSLIVLRSKNIKTKKISRRTENEKTIIVITCDHALFLRRRVLGTR